MNTFLTLSKAIIHAKFIGLYEQMTITKFEYWNSSKEFKSLNEIILQVLKGQPWVWTLENLVHYSDKKGGNGIFVTRD
jgi:hypothetical protein